MDQTYTVRGAFGEPVAEYAGGTPVLKYWNYVRPDGVVIGRKEGANRFFYHRDHLGSTRTVLSQHTTPTVVETYDYMPFGEFMAGRITTSGTGTRPKFTGHAFDDETNLHTMQWRRQIPRYGVFRTPDPMADEYPGWNAYAYVMNDPMRYLDPTGLCPTDGSAGMDKETGLYCTEAIVVTADRYDGFLTTFYSFFAENYYDPNYAPAQNLTSAQFMTALDVAGTVDPTGFIDITSAVLYAIDGDIGNTLISAGSILPGGDLLKASRVATKGAAKGSNSVIKGFTKHAADQALTRGFKTADIQKIVREGTPVEAMGRYGAQVRYTLGENTVVVNAQGKVVTVYSSAAGTANGLGKGNFIPFIE